MPERSKAKPACAKALAGFLSSIAATHIRVLPRQVRRPKLDTTARQIAYRSDHGANGRRVHQSHEALCCPHARLRVAEDFADRLEEALLPRIEAEGNTLARRDARKALGRIGRGPKSAELIDQSVRPPSAPDQTRPLAMSCTWASGNLRPFATFAVKSA